MRRWTFILLVLCACSRLTYAQSADGPSIVRQRETRLRAPDGSVREVPRESYEYALQDGYERIPQSWVRDPRDGTMMLVDEDFAAGAVGRGWWRMTDDEIRDAGLEMPWRPASRPNRWLATSMLAAAVAAISVAWVAIRRRRPAGVRHDDPRL